LEADCESSRRLSSGSLLQSCSGDSMTRTPLKLALSHALRTDAVHRTHSSLEADRTALMLASDVMLQLCKGFAQFAYGDYAGVVDTLFG
jgi:hypothetical protein